MLGFAGCPEEKRQFFIFISNVALALVLWGISSLPETKRCVSISRKKALKHAKPRFRAVFLELVVLGDGGGWVLSRSGSGGRATDRLQIGPSPPARTRTGQHPDPDRPQLSRPGREAKAGSKGGFSPCGSRAAPWRVRAEPEAPTSSPLPCAPGLRPRSVPARRRWRRGSPRRRSRAGSRPPRAGRRRSRP